MIEDGDQEWPAEVVGFRGHNTMLMPLADVRGLRPGALVATTGTQTCVGVSSGLIGRVINGLGEPIDSGPPIIPEEYRALVAEPPHPLRRNRFSRPLPVGVRAIDALLTIGEGQRVGIFAGSGVGKSVLLGMVARFTEADVVVIGLVGERGREVRDFVESTLGEEGMRKSVVVTETSDRWPLLRMKAAMTATAVAEYFRDAGARVLLLMDSVTRVSHAMREVGLSLGEPPATRGYPPSVFATLPKLLERSGNSERGSITGIYTVLVDGDDITEPVTDCVRSILDGHIVLTRELAMASHYPAIDVTKSISRVMTDIVSPDHQESAARFKELLAAYKEHEDLISVGAYARGSNAILDKAIELRPAMSAFLRQPIAERALLRESTAAMQSLVRGS